MLFLHVCCADCLLNYLESLRQLDFDKNEEIILYFYNNNIHPKLEYQARLKGVKWVCENNDLVKSFKTKLMIANYQPQKYFKGLKNLDKNLLWTENRCNLCWQMRLKQTFEQAQESKAQTFSTTLLVSLYQNVEKITQIGRDLSKNSKVAFLKPEKIITDYQATGFYKQNYCGCCFSLASKAIEKFLS
jgi:predicted adenine nucleotide alpha hydrolase (AANH) superfamily ATPase